MALTGIGNTDFVQIGQPKWKPGGLVQLDTLEITYQGLYSKLAAFQNTLTKWAQSNLDSNMFLETWSDDGHPVKPLVTLRYIGCRGGQLPAVAIKQGDSLTTASTTGVEISVLYRSPHTQQSWIGNNDTMTHSGFSNPRAITIVERRVAGHIPYFFWTRQKAQYEAALLTAAPEDVAGIEAILAALETKIAANLVLIEGYVAALFAQTDQVTAFEATPLVPGRYWACESVTSKVLVPF